MMKRIDISLVMLPPWGINNPPVSLAYLAAYLRFKNIKVQILDLNIDVYHRIPKWQKVFWEFKSVDKWRLEKNFQRLLRQGLCSQVDYCVKRLLNVESRIMGFSVNRANLRFTIEVIKNLKSLRPDLIIMLGGHSCSIEGERIIVPDELVDAFVIGEGEKTLYEILKSIKEGKKLEGIPGVLLSGGYKFIPCKFIENLDSIPYPDYQDFVLEKYDIAFGGWPIVSSRGCPRKCVFCNDIATWGYTFRYRKAQHIFDEIKHYIDKFNINFFEFTDSACNGNLRELEKLTELLIDSKNKIKWIGNMMIRSDLTYGLLKKIKHSGCQLLRYGVESGSDKILKKMNKGFNSHDAERILHMSHEAGIENHINLIVGFPGEGEVEFNETVEFLRRNSQYISRVANIFPCFIAPGSRLEQKYKEYKITLPDDNFATTWYDELGNTYPRRKKRIEKLVDIISELNIEIDDSGVYILEEDYESKKESLTEIDGNLKPESINLKFDKERVKLNILMVHPHDIFDEFEPWTVRITNIAKEFINEGHLVKLIYFPLDPSKARYGIQPEGFEVIPLCRSCGPRNLINNTFKIYKMLEWADIVHFQKCFYYASIPTLLASWLRKKPIHYDWDDWETKIFYYGIVQLYRRPIGIFMHLLERLIPKLVDTVSVSSQKLAELAINWGVNKRNLFKAPVGADLEKFNPSISGDDIRQKFKINSLLVLYLGQLHGGQYAELFIQAAKQILDNKDDNLRVTFMIVGGGYRFRELKKMAMNLGISGDTIFTDFIEHRNVPYYIAAADICVACFQDNDITRCKSPLKIAEYLASGKAIVASNVGEVRNMVGGVGILVKPGDSDALARAIMKVLKDENLREEMGKRARKRAEKKYNWEVAANNLLKTYSLTLK